MKCSKTINQLSGSERKRLMNEIQKANGEFLEEQCKIIRNRVTNNLFKIVVATINENFGFGKERIEKLLQCINQKVVNSENKEEFWLLTEEQCKKILTKEVYFNYFTDEPFKLEIRSNEQ